MATWDDVRAIALALPGTEEHPSWGGEPSWRVRSHGGFVRSRPLGKKDRADLGAAAPAPEEPIIGIHLADLGEKEALLGTQPEVFFTIPHLDGYPMVLALLDRIDRDELAELITDAWRLSATKRAVAAYDAAHPSSAH